MLDIIATFDGEAAEAARTHDPALPGKFEGEPAATVYFWHYLMLGEGEEVGPFAVFEVDPKEAEFLGLSASYYAIRADSRGFVYGMELSSSDLDAFRAHYQEG